MQTLTEIWALATKPFLVISDTGYVVLVQQQVHGGFYLGELMTPNELGYVSMVDNTVCFRGDQPIWTLI